ncbi:MAG: hypothetical protein OXG64_04600 [Chloroflexi bacterium]|nr:hypothetical protein [Chloroflexota bacterium]
MDSVQFEGTETVILRGARGPLEVRGSASALGIVESLGGVGIDRHDESTTISLSEMSTVQVPAGGRLELGDVNGPLRLQGIERDLVLSAVNGPLQVRDLSGDIDLTGPVNGPLRVQGARKLSGAAESPIRGEVKLADLAEVDLAQVIGNLAIRQVSGAVRLGEVIGHVRAAGLDRGLSAGSIKGNLLLEGRVTGDSLWEARVEGRTRLRLHPESSARLELESENHPSTLDSGFEVVERSDRRVVATLGTGQGCIAIRAEGPIAAKVGASWDAHEEFDDAFAKAGDAVERAMAEMTSALDAAFDEVGAELAGIGADLDFGGLGERVSTRVRREVDRHTRQVARRIRRAHRQSHRRTRRHPAAARRATSPSAQITPDEREARVREILRGVQDGSLDVVEADRQLSELPPA